MKKFLFSTAVFCLFMLSAGDVFACSCLMDNTKSVSKKVKTSYKQASAVFYGEVTGVKPKSGAGEAFDPGLVPVEVKFKVFKFWKGEITSEVIVYTEGDSAMCGFNFEIGKRYLVYASDAGNGLQTTICTRTAASNADAKYLNKIKKPKKF